MRFAIAILCCALLAAPADARLFRRGGGNSGGNCANGKCGLKANQAKVDVAVNANADQKKTADDATANQLADVLTRFDDLAVKQYVPPNPAVTQTPPAQPPAVDTSKIDELTKVIAELKQQIDDLKNKPPATPPWTPPAKETPAIGDQPAPPKPAKVVYDIERKN